MKKIFISIVLCFATTFAFSVKPHIVNVPVSTKESSVKWIGYKVTSSHEGNVEIQKGYLANDHGTLVGGQFSIDMNSITCTDIKSEKKNKYLVDHLKDPDFFNVDLFPIATISIVKAIRVKGEDNYKIIADLKIKNISHSISFDATVVFDGTNYKASAKIQIDRTKWDVRYGSGSFFEDLGDKMIKDEIDFVISLVSQS